MPNNPQNTLGLTALKFYGNMRSVRLEALSWLKIVDKEGNTARTTTIPRYHKSQLIDYITIDITHPTVTIPLSPKTPFKQMTHINMLTDLNTREKGDIMKQQGEENKDNPIETDFTFSTKVMVMSTLFPPKANLTFTKHEDTDLTILHRRFDHISDVKLATMCQKQLLEGLPARFPIKEQCHKRDCWICPRGTLHNDPHGITLNTDHLKPGQLLHMDFYFLNEVSIRGFIAVLLILDAKSRKMWQFPTPQKRPPIDIVRFFLMQLKRMNRTTQHVRTDCGGELARSAEFCATMKNEFQIGIERTGTYSSWFNGKVERHIQTACGMLRLGTIDHGLGEQLWCCKCDDVTQKYNATLHSAHNEVHDYLWYGRRPSAWEFRTFGCKIEARINTHLKKLDERTEPGYYLGTTSTKAVIRYWIPEKPKQIQYCTTARFLEYQTILPDGSLSPGSSITHK